MEWNAKLTEHPYDGRNYDLFAMLADVRNGRGFAGVKTGDGFNPIADPKDLPEDVSEEVKKESDSWGSDGHSHSWFTVSELLAYDWNQKTKKTGAITIDEYKKLKDTGKEPETWCGSVSGNNIETVSTREADRLISKKTASKKEYYVQYEWGIEYKDHAGYFLETTIPTLQALGENDSVRIVFWFDN